VYDTNGKKYLDALAGLWATALGMYNITFTVIYFSYLFWMVYPFWFMFSILFGSNDCYKCNSLLIF